LDATNPVPAEAAKNIKIATEKQHDFIEKISFCFGISNAVEIFVLLIVSLFFSGICLKK
jgi:hypothetical protein